MSFILRMCAVSAFALHPFAQPAAAQTCSPHWLSGTFNGAGFNNTVFALAEFDDGSGPALYAGGSFTSVDGLTAQRIARWNGSAWTPPIAAFTNNEVAALAVFDDGSGPALYIGGNFTTIGGLSIANIARYDGSAYTPVGGGVNGLVHTLAVFDDGSGPALYAGGIFNSAGGNPAWRIARWNGSDWSAVGGHISGASVLALAVYDDGSGPVLVAAGDFSSAGGVNAPYLARWNGNEWAAFGGAFGSTAPNGVARSLATYNGRLYIGGSFSAVGPLAANGIARWDGSSFSALGAGVTGGTPRVNALAVFDDGEGPLLFAAGAFLNAGGFASNRLARWNGSEWLPLNTAGLGGIGWTLLVTEVGGHASLAVGGAFTAPGPRLVRRAAADLPSITVHPDDAEVDEGESASMSVEAGVGGAGGGAGEGELAYQWRHNGKPIDDEPKSGYSGSDSPTLIIDPVSAEHEGWYDVVVSNACGEVVSIAASLTVNAGTPGNPADLNGDDVVDVLDLLILLDAWGACKDCKDAGSRAAGGACPADFNGDCAVDVLDLLFLLDNWG